MLKARARSLAADLPASLPDPKTAQLEELAAMIAALQPDAMTPKDALQTLYLLQKKLAEL